MKNINDVVKNYIKGMNTNDLIEINIEIEKELKERKKKREKLIESISYYIKKP